MVITATTWQEANNLVYLQGEIILSDMLQLRNRGYKIIKA